MAAAKGVSEATQQRVLAAVEASPAITEDQLAASLNLRPATIWTALLNLQGRKFIRWDNERRVWQRTIPLWMQPTSNESE